MMTDYLKFWGVDGPIFRRQPAPGQLYWPEALAPRCRHLLLACSQPCGLQMISGLAGSGKTCLARWLYAKLDPLSVECAFLTLLSSQEKAGWLLGPLSAYLLGKGYKQGEGLRALEEGLWELRQEDRQLLLILDAADYLKTETALADLTLLFDLAMMVEGRLAVLLVAEAAFGERLAGYKALSSRLQLHLALSAFSREEVAAYLQWHLQAAGMRANPFSEQAIDGIYHYSEGMPRKINILAEGCLIEAYLRQSSTVALEILNHLLGLQGLKPSATGQVVNLEL